VLALPRSRIILAVRFQGIDAVEFIIRLCQMILPSSKPAVSNRLKLTIPTPVKFWTGLNFCLDMTQAPVVNS
jgi:hypothetical protein